MGRVPRQFFDRMSVKQNDRHHSPHHRLAQAKAGLDNRNFPLRAGRHGNKAGHEVEEKENLFEA